MKDKLFSLKNLWRRITSESPSYFKKLRALMLWLAGIGGGLAALIAQWPGLFPEADVLRDVAKYLLVCGVVAAAITFLPVSDNTGVRPS